MDDIHAIPATDIVRVTPHYAVGFVQNDGLWDNLEAERGWYIFTDAENDGIEVSPDISWYEATLESSIVAALGPFESSDEAVKWIRENHGDEI
jgi:hypothetical protein